MYEVAAKTLLEELGYVVVLRSEYLLACAALFCVRRYYGNLGIQN